MSSNKNRIWIGAVAGMAALSTATAALACPLCSEETEAQEKETGVNVSMGYSVSVLLMIAVPMSMVGGLGYALYRNAQQMNPSHGDADDLLPPE